MDTGLLQRLFTTLLLVLLTAGIVGGTTYYVLSSNYQIERAANENIYQFKEFCGRALGVTTSEATQKTSSITLTDEDILRIDTINKSGLVKKDSYVAPAIVTKDENWAVTAPVPVNYVQSTGYSVPGMGGISYLWHKVNGSWTFVGQAGESGWDKAVKDKFSEIPKTIITDAQRN